MTDAPLDQIGVEPLQPLDGIDSMHLKIEEPKQPQMIVTTVVLDTSTVGQEISAEVWQKNIMQRLLQLPLLHRVYTPNPLGRAVWVHRDKVDLDYHFSHTWHDGPLTDDFLAGYAALRMKRPYDRSRPFWDAAIVQERNGPGLAVVLRIHHSVVDGMMKYTILDALYDAAMGPSATPLSADDPIQTPASVTEAAESVRDSLPKELLRQSIRSKLTALKDAPAVARDSVVAKRATAKLIAEAGDANLAPPAWGGRTSWGRRRSSGRVESAWARIDAGRVRAISDAVNVNVADVVMAAATGAFRTKMLEDGTPPKKPLILGYPISTRPPEEKYTPGNFTGSINLPLQVQLADPIERLRATHKARKLGIEIFRSGGPRVQERRLRYLPRRPTSAFFTAYGSLGIARFHPQVYDGWATMLPLDIDGATILGAPVVDVFLSSGLNDLSHIEFMITRTKDMLRWTSSADPANFSGIGLFTCRAVAEIGVMEQRLAELDRPAIASQP